MRIIPDVKLDYKDVLLVPKRSTLTSRRDVDLTRKYTFKHSQYEYNGIPIMASNMDGVGTFNMARELAKHNMMTVVRKHYTMNEWSHAVNVPNASRTDIDFPFDNVAVSTGTNAIFNDSAADYKLMSEVLENYPINFLCIDVANGYQENFVEFVEKTRERYPDKVIIAGNVITPEMVEQLIISGADIVKCGIGPGSACTTRIKAGVGYPQLSGVIECADAAHGLGGHIIADGGCTNPGDVAKAFGAGADFVMLGGMLAGHEEGEYDEVKDGNVIFYGMSSDVAMAKHGSRKDGYRSAEGRVVSIPYRGPVQNTLTEVEGGVRSACTYVGARRLKDIGKCAVFVQVRRTHNDWFETYDTGDV